MDKRYAMEFQFSFDDYIKYWKEYSTTEQKVIFLGCMISALIATGGIAWIIVLGYSWFWTKDADKQRFEKNQTTQNSEAQPEAETKIDNVDERYAQYLIECEENYLDVKSREDWDAGKHILR